MDIITTEPESRQIARTLHFAADVAPYIDWNRIAETAQDLGAHFEVRTAADTGDVTVTMWWSEGDGPHCIGYGPDPERRD